MIGVSPAFYLSKYGTHFKLSHLLESMTLIKEQGFENLQLEIFHPEQLEEWTDESCRKLKEHSRESGIGFSQFCAHFLLASFNSPESLRTDWGYKEADFLGERLAEFGLTKTVTIPVAAFSGNPGDSEMQDLFHKKIEVYRDIFTMRDISLALEPQPGSLCADLSFLERHSGVGLNLDPGHLLCSGIDPFSLDCSVLSRVISTHLCENDGKENLSSAPGTHDYPWEKLMGNLQSCGYPGSYDLEIICPSESVGEIYGEAKFFLKQYCMQNK